MKHLTAAALLVASVASAGAQSYQTALPLSPAERRALESRLSTILEFSGADEMSRFQLPSGRSITVLPYRMVRSGPRPCRGYRIDLEGRQSRTAVDGFRCKRRNGEAWVIVEPELVLAQEGPRELRPRDDRPRGERRASSEPLYADDLFSSPSATASASPPPVPRPAPDRSRDTAAAETAEPPVSDAAQTAEAPAETAPTTTALARPVAEGRDDAVFASRVAAVLGDDEDTAAIAAPPDGAADDQAQEDTPPVETAAATEPAASTPLVTTEPTRIVASTERTDEVDYSGSEAVVAGLTDLAYLSGDDDATRQRVEAAVGEFAVDERFALPVSVDVLIERLDAAIERSQSLPDCSTDSLADLCTLEAD